jgi:hypothetical protein
MQRQTLINLWFIVLAIVGVLLLQQLWTESQRIEPIPYSAFETYPSRRQGCRDHRLSELHSRHAQAATAQRPERVRREPGRTGSGDRAIEV